jgi:hypothetical protein
MGYFLNYTGIPIFANFTGQNGSVITNSAENFFATTLASLSIDPNLVQNRFVNVEQSKNDFSHNGPLEGKLSFTFYPLIEVNAGATLNISKSNQLAFFNLTGDFEDGHNIKLSNLLLKQCFLDNYSIKIEPFKPISVTSNFTVYDMTSAINTEISETQSNFSITKNSSPNYSALHGTTSKLVDSNKYGEVKLSLNLTVESRRVPVYGLGAKYPDKMFLKSVERTTTIKSNNIKQIIDITGGYVGNSSLYLMPYSQLANPLATPNAQYSVLTFDIDGRIFSQQLSVNQNEIMDGSIVIKEIIL